MGVRYIADSLMKNIADAIRNRSHDNIQIAGKKYPDAIYGLSSRLIPLKRFIASGVVIPLNKDETNMSYKYNGVNFKAVAPYNSGDAGTTPIVTNNITDIGYFMANTMATGTGTELILYCDSVTNVDGAFLNAHTSLCRGVKFVNLSENIESFRDVFCNAGGYLLYQNMADPYYQNIFIPKHVKDITYAYADTVLTYMDYSDVMPWNNSYRTHGVIPRLNLYLPNTIERSYNAFWNTRLGSGSAAPEEFYIDFEAPAYFMDVGNELHIIDTFSFSDNLNNVGKVIINCENVSRNISRLTTLMFKAGQKSIYPFEFIGHNESLNDVSYMFCNACPRQYIDTMGFFNNIYDQLENICHFTSYPHFSSNIPGFHMSPNLKNAAYAFSGRDASNKFHRSCLFNWGVGTDIYLPQLTQSSSDPSCCNIDMLFEDPLSATSTNASGMIGDNYPCLNFYVDDGSFVWEHDYHRNIVTKRLSEAFGRFTNDYLWTINRTDVDPSITNYDIRDYIANWIAPNIFTEIDDYSVIPYVFYKNNFVNLQAGDRSLYHQSMSSGEIVDLLTNLQDDLIRTFPGIRFISGSPFNSGRTMEWLSTNITIRSFDHDNIQLSEPYIELGPLNIYNNKYIYPNVPYSSSFIPFTIASNAFNQYQFVSGAYECVLNNCDGFKGWLTNEYRSVFPLNDDTSFGYYALYGLRNKWTYNKLYKNDFSNIISIMPPYLATKVTSAICGLGGKPFYRRSDISKDLFNVTTVYPVLFGYNREETCLIPTRNLHQQKVNYAKMFDTLFYYSNGQARSQHTILRSEIGMMGAVFNNVIIDGDPLYDDVRLPHFTISSDGNHLTYPKNDYYNHADLFIGINESECELFRRNEDDTYNSENPFGTISIQEVEWDTEDDHLSFNNLPILPIGNYVNVNVDKIYKQVRIYPGYANERVINVFRVVR